MNISQSKHNQSYTLDDFILQNKIGSGSFGKIFKVKDKKTDEILVAKISINRIEKDFQDQLHDLSREVNILSKLNHPSILKFIFYSPFDFKKKPKPVIITEYASYGSLDKLLNNSNPTNNIINSTHKLIIIYGIASALSYLHSNNIIHRDLKPANILLDQFLLPKVADFGLSKFSHKSDNSMTMSSIGSIKGTPIYMSPEIWLDAEYSQSSDVYAFAMIVYEMITNLKPFDNFNIFQIQIQIQKGYRPEIGTEISNSYRALIQDCWAQDPLKRPTFDQILDRLENDRGFITESVNESDFLKYINYIKNYKSSFDQSKNPFYFDFDDVKINKMNTNLNIVFDVDNLTFFSYDQYKDLDENCRKLVDDAKDDAEKLYNIGISFIEGRETFPINTEVGIQYLKKSIEKGFTKSAIYYCEMIIKGNIILQDFKKAAKIAESKLNDDEGYQSLILGKIEKKKQNFEKAFKLFVKSTELGNIDAIFELGKMFYRDDGETNNIDLAIAFFKRAIEKGSIKAMYKYGLHLEFNQIDEEKGIQLIKMSADKGYKKGCYIYSLMNRENPVQYMKKASEKGHIESMLLYAMYLDNYEQNESFLKESKLLLKKASDRGNFKAMYFYGMLFFNGKGVDINMQEAAKFLKIAAENGNEDAISKYGEMLLFGKGIQQDIEKAIMFFKKGIELGNAESMTLYAYALLYGEGVPINKKEAIKYYKMAIEKGDIDAINNYAYMLQYGEGVPVNKQEAIKYYKMAIEKGSVVAINNIVFMLKYDDDESINKDEIINILKQEIEKGNTYCMNEYASMCYIGEGLPVNKEESFKYYKISSDNGNSDAMANYAVLLLDKDINNKDEAIKYFELAVQYKNPNAMVMYANELLKGERIEMNKEKAIELFKMAIDLNHLEAMDRYATILANGEGLPVDKKEALKYYKMASDEGYPESMYNYGCLLLKDENVTNKEEALKYIKMSIDRGFPKAMIEYASLIYEGKIPGLNMNDAFKYLEMAINRGSTDAMAIYASFIYTYNEQEALKYIQKAVDKGNSYAMFLLANHYYMKNGSKMNEEILNYFKIAADNGSIDSIKRLATYLYLGLNVQQNKKEATKYFMIAINKGDVESMHMYGRCLLKESNQEEALKYLKMAANKGIVEAMHECGLLLCNGTGIKTNKEEAFYYFKKASEHGDINSTLECAYMLLKGDGIPINKEESKKYFKIAALKGNSFGLYQYGKMLYKDEIEPEKQIEGINYIEMAASKYNPKAMFFYGLLLEEEPKFYENAINYFRHSANLGNVKAIRHYNSILDDEEKNTKYIDKERNKKKVKKRRSFSFIESDKSLIFKELDNSCKKDFINAEYNEIDSVFFVAKSFIEGINNFPKNVDIGIKYLKKACKTKNIEAYNYYSKMLLNDKEFEKSFYVLNEISSIYMSSFSKLNLVHLIKSHESFDVNIETSEQSINYTLAKKLSQEAAECGNLRGMILYANLCLKWKKNRVCEIKPNQHDAIHYFKRAAKKGDGEAMAFYGICLESGVGFYEKKCEKAIKYYKKSYDKGDLNGYALYGNALIQGENGKTEEGLQLVKYSFEHNNPIGIHIYANYLYSGLPYLKKNDKLAFHYYKIAASLGNCESFYNCSHFYINVIGTDINIKEAIKYYKKGAEEGKIHCAYDLGMLLLKNNDKEDFIRGMEYLKFAAENGDIDAIIYFLSKIKEKKLSNEEILDLKIILEKGVYLKNINFILLYAKLFSETSILHDKVKSARYFKMAADLGNIMAMKIYASFLSEGNGVVKNLDESLKYYKKAADNGD